ncbi:putative teichuronic acid biosynthesis glycosyltransferase TuaH [Clostridium puniceum]|uniref:Putative teichuronic acid biosynthesis glycosyltransferase TuaH n=1 Tax=Clostridium puniceum TaxID=29367 RepID=A0A1S8TDF5_9CLOT|nr:glycosyltransferase [Clostridium puniceum]OOM75830.1 putative teichuronic acid biosynthesis glycosyltransferase TuaH [Clostridium puniceum]
MKSILYISLADWCWIKQRPQHFCEIMSELNYEIEYFCKRPWRKIGKCLEGFRNNSSVKIIRQRILPYESRYRIIEKINNLIIRRKIKHMVKKKYEYIILTHPNQINFLTHNIIEENKIIYDCMDNYKELFKNNIYRSNLVPREKALINCTTKIVASSETIKENLIKAYGAKEQYIKVINNGVDLKNFNIDLHGKNAVLNNMNKKVGYIGTVSNWFDVDILKFAALKKPNIDFYVIGPIMQDCKIKLQVKNISNIYLAGAEDYRNLPIVLNNLDVAIMPFKLNKLIECVNPVKIYEYLAMNKPVVAVRYKETEKFKDLIYLYSNKEEFIEKLNKALSERVIYTSRRDYALKNSWEYRVKEFIKFIEE